MRNIGLIVGREFRERVYKKSFIITTILMPLLMILLGAAPTLIMEFVDSETKKITVVDESGIVAPKLTSDQELVFEISDQELPQALVDASQNEDNFGVLYIGKDIVANPNDARLYTSASSSLVLEESIADQIEKVIESERLKAYNIDNIDEILENVKASVHLATFRTDKDEESAATSAVASSLIGMLLGFLLYFILAIYGSMVMQSVIDEKSSRILEVMVSTVKPFEMLMGKILGIALVAAVQVLVWGVLIVLFSAVIMPALMPENILESVRKFAKGRVVVVFGCGGDRDKTKRPKMGRVAGRIADFCIVTSDNPRTEEPDAIIRDILDGMDDAMAEYVVIENRRDAIEYAIRHARKDDVIVLAGKGHEDYQILKDKTIHFDEREVIRDILSNM